MIVITGGAGFIGCCLAKYLNELGYFDIFIVDDLGSASTGKWKNLKKISFKDFIHKNDFLNVFDKLPRPDVIYHLGACSSNKVDDANYYLLNNYDYTKNLCFKAIQNKIKFVYASSSETYGDGEQGFKDSEIDLFKLSPRSIYAYSKHLFDLFAQRSNLFHKHRIIGLKFFSIFGPAEEYKENSSSIIFKSYQALESGQSLQLFKSYTENLLHGEQSRDFLYIKDAVKLILYLSKHPHDLGGIYNIGSGVATTSNQMAEALFGVVGRRVPVDYVEMPANVRKHFRDYTQADMQKTFATSLSNYPIPKLHSFEESIKDYVEDYLGKNIFDMSK